MTPRILSGIQPSGKLHLGNYFGAIRQHLALQDQGEAFYFVADYHALTTLKDAEERANEAGSPTAGKRAKQILAENVRDVATDYLALGLDPAKATLYRQSDVPEVCELAWFLACVTGVGLLERATSYKDKVAKGLPASAGLFTYPVLMAADILSVRANVVPVGLDQRQHLEMTGHMAGCFNRAYDEVFPIPEARLVAEGAGGKVPGTDGQKMSKSYGNTIDIFAEGKDLKRAVAGIVTDATPLDEPKDPDSNTVFALYSLFATDQELAEMRRQFAEPQYRAQERAGRSFGYGDAKAALVQAMDREFGEARARRKRLAADPAAVEAVLAAGARKAQAEARETLRRVREAVGMAGRVAGNVPAG